MAKIETTFAFYKTKAAYNEQVNNGGGFADTTVVFIKDTREIVTHGTVVCSMDEFFNALAGYAKYDANGNLPADGFIHRGGGASDLLTADGGLVPKANFAPAKKYAELDADDNLTVMGNIDANGNLHTYGTVSVESGSSDDILMADGSFQSLQQLKNTISSVPKFSVKVVSALPATGDESTIYLLKSGGDEGNLYTEYLYVNGAWEMLGAQSLNLSGYAKVDDLNDVNNKVPASANATDNGGDIEILFGNTSGKYLFSAVLNLATHTSSGVMSAADKTKLDSALTEHQKLYIFTVKINGVELEVYKPNITAGEIDLTPEILGALSNDDGKAIAKAIAEAVARAQEAYSYTDNLRNQFDAHTHDYAPTNHTHPYLPTSGGDITGNLTVMGDIDANGNLHTYGTVSVESGSSDDILMADGSFQSLQAIKEAISAIPKFRTIVVNSLPDDAEFKSESAIYLVKSGNDAQNIYTEYIWINGAWEELGTQKVSLDGYLTTSNLAVEVYEDTENEIYIRLKSGISGFGEAMLPIVSPIKAGLMSTTDKTKLDSALTAHQKLYIFTVKINGVELEVYKPNISAGEINLTPEILGALSNDDGKAIAKAIAEAVARAQEAYSYTDNLRNQFDAHEHPQYLTSHQSIYTLTINVNGVEYEVFKPNVRSSTINITPDVIGAAEKQHTHPYLPLTGGEVNGNVTVAGEVSVNGANINVTQGNVYAEGNIEAGTSLIADSVMINNGTADQILLGNGSTTSLKAIKEAISAIPKFRTIVVNSLPDDAEFKSESAIYLVKSGNDAQNLYTEYIWINGAWEKLGEQKVDLYGYLNTGNTSLGIYQDTENEIDLEISHDTFVFASTRLPIASSTGAGLMSTTDKTKLDSALTEHQKLYIFTVKINGVELEVYKPNIHAGEINLTPEILGALSNDDGKAIAKAIAEAVARAQEAYSYTDNLRNQFDAHTHDYAPTNHTHPYLPTSGGDITGNLTVMGDIDANGNLHTYGTVSVESGSSDDILMADGSFQSLQQLKNAISSVPKFSVKVVSALPATGDESTIYLLKSGGDEGNLYTEYLYVNGAWEMLGAQSLNLSGYAKVDDLNDVNNKVPASANATDNGGDIEILFGNTSGKYLFSAVLNLATHTSSGVMSAADKTKLDSALTEHQKLYIFTVKINGVELEVYKPNIHAGEIDLTPEILGALSNDDGKAIAKAIAEAVARAQEAYSYTDNLRNQFDAHTHEYLPISGGIVRGDINIDGTLYVDNIKGYSENSSYITLGTGNNTGFVYITDDMFGKNENGEQSWSIGANTGHATFSGITQTSDQRLKENIHDVDKSFTEKYWATENGLIHEYDWKKSGKHANGMIAQELLNYIPEAVNHNVENDTYSVDYTSATCKMMGAMFQKIKELENEIITIKQVIEKLKNN